jgi:guanosine-3',5'-bis(diphosphate) 3'-pyrophosphohydrolase
MNLIKAELQDLGFRDLHPWRHAVIEKRIRMQPVVRREALTQIEARLAQRLTKEGFSYRLVGPHQVAVEHLQQDARGGRSRSTR